MKNTVLAFAACVALMSTVDGLAQVRVGGGRWFVPAAVGYGAGRGGYGYGYGGVGTAASAEGQAMADVIRSQGQYNAMTSGAMINYEQARGQYIDNQKEWLELYQMRQRVYMHNQELAAEDKRVRAGRLKEYQETHPVQPPPRLVSMQLDPVTGALHWPTALQGDGFAPLRTELEELFATRAHTGTTAQISEAILKKVKEMQSELRSKIRDLPTQQYMDARKFLEALSREGQLPLG